MWIYTQSGKTQNTGLTRTPHQLRFRLLVILVLQTKPYYIAEESLLLKCQDYKHTSSVPFVVMEMEPRALAHAE